MTIYKLLPYIFSENTRLPEAAYILDKHVIHQMKALTGKAGMGISLVNPYARVATTPTVDQEIADRGVLKSDWVVVIFDVYD